MTAPNSIDPDALEPTIDLPLSQQKRILRFLVRLKGTNYYELLGVSRDADKREIQQAYFSLMNEFHEDRYYGKDLGGFESRMRTIVEALTRASNTLGRNRTRQEYDAALGGQPSASSATVSPLGRNVASQESSSGPPSSSRSNSSMKAASDSEKNWSASSETRELTSPRIPATPRTPVDLRWAASSSNGGAKEGVPQPAESRPAPSGRMGGHPSTNAKRLLARKMKRLSRPPPSIDKSEAENVRRAVDHDLKTRYDARRNSDKQPWDKYVLMSEEAEAAADWSSAVNAMRMAMDLAPEDPKLALRWEKIQKLADIALAPRLLERAKSEEKDERYEQAARSYERAARGKKSAELFAKGALCLLKCGRPEGEDARKLVELARQAVSLDNDNATYRVTLARAYDVVGMKSSALAEVGRALSLEPDNNDAKQLHKSLK